MIKKLKNTLLFIGLFTISYSFLYGMESQESTPLSFSTYYAFLNATKSSKESVPFPYKKKEKIETLLSCCERAVLNKLFFESSEEIDLQLRPPVGSGVFVPEEIRERLTQRMDNLPKDNIGNTLLHKAESSFHVRKLLALGVPYYNARNTCDETPLLALLKKLKIQAAIALLEKAPEDLDVNYPDCYGQRPLVVASQINSLTIKNLLIERGAVQNRGQKLKDSWLDVFRSEEKSLEQQKIDTNILLYLDQTLSQKDSVQFFYGRDKETRNKIEKAISEPLSTSGITRFHLAKTALDVQKLLFLGADYTKKTKNGENCLHYMIKCENTSAAFKLLEILKNDEAKQECNSVDCYHTTPLCTAVLLGDTSLVKALVNKGADVDYLHTSNQDNNFVNIFLFIVTHGENIEMMEFLFSRSLKPIKDDIKMSLFTDAIDQNNAYMLYKLMPQGLTLDTYIVKGHNLLMNAINMHRFKCAEKLIKGQALIYDENTQQVVPVSMDCLVPPNSQRVTPFLLAVGHGNYDLVKLLLKRGAKVSDKVQKGLTALMLAAGSNNPSIITLLLEHGASLVDEEGKELTDKNGKTALHFAAKYNNIEGAKLLVDAGANVLAQDNEGNTPQYIAFLKDNMTLSNYFYEIERLKELPEWFFKK